MALPVLITVAALGAGWVALSAKRVELSQANPGGVTPPQATPVVEGSKVGDAIATPQSPLHELTVVGDSGASGTVPGGTTTIAHDEIGGKIDVTACNADPTTSPSTPMTSTGCGRT